MKNIAAIFIAMLLVTNAVYAESPLNTRTNTSIGLSLSSYQYQEPGLMSLTGGKMGLDLNSTSVLRDEQFVRGDLRYALGTVDYTGSGNASGQPDWYIEARVLIGKDSALNDAVLSPYFGFGYRYLFNDMRGITSTGAAGYRRESNYVYMPFGIIHRMSLNGQANLETTLEYDHLLAGKQVSRLSDTGLGYGDLNNNQNKGYGLKLSVMYKKDEWTVGPFVHYWNIGKSDTTFLFRYGTLVGTGWEPENNTVEFGLKAGLQF